MLKLSSTQVKQVLVEASEELQKLAHENLAMQEKIAYFERKERCEKIADLMSQKGVRPELTRQEKIAELISTEKSLDVIEEAVKLEPEQIKVASLSDRKGSEIDEFTKLIFSLGQ